MNRTILSLVLIFSAFSVFAQNLPAPTGLLTELLREPEKAVITDSNPEFGWIFPQEGVTQTAYQILVASSPGLLTEKGADLWNSGKINTAASINVSYKGKNLSPHSKYWWKVKVWGKDGKASVYSEPQQFITGTFDWRSDEWTGVSNWVELAPGNWVTEDRQMASFTQKEPVLFKKVSEGNWFADFGQAAFATADFSITSDVEGQKIRIYLGERKNEDLSVHKNPGRSNIGFFQTEIELKKGTHTYQVKIPPHSARYPHSQKMAPFYPEVVPFRYTEIESDGKIKVNSITQEALYYLFDDSQSAFNSPNENLNKVWDLCKYTLKATPFLGVYSDGNRERMPYEADAYIQQLGHYAVDREFSAARYSLAFLVSHASWPSEWQMHTVMMAREHYMHTGDTEFLAMIYNDLKKKTLIDLQREDGLISTKTGKLTPEVLKGIHFTGERFRDIVDWPPVENDNYEFADYNTVVNSFYFYSLKCMSEIAAALGKNEDSNFYKTHTEKVKQSILRNMFDTQKGYFVDGNGAGHASLHANMFPLAFNLVPEKDIPSVAQYIKSKGMACSVYGAQYLLEALYNAGEAEYALKLMTSEDKRSWMNMIKVGSTMTTEAWDEAYKPNLTWNHAWATAPANIIPRRLMGIQPVDPGFKTFAVNPQPTGLQDIQLTIPTIRGAITCKLKSNPEEWEMELSVPGNSEALVLLPSELANVKVNGKKAEVNSTVEYLGMSRNLFKLASGTYLISAKK
ncbi:alpha-L-rhamnosidase [Maribellus luteus]|uniref:alpha-L-rhamnosidase n=1 Tax=Maribellus luteus TaxID=2305463 RepID=A0A399T1F6_9BACT|nr:alpha-L-rhamnosidase C-terminal domain-containing protein [Maribellus luteus]RIJ50126.1 alpha-L-rhamnosidase [Maribellus luteus]